MTFLEKDTRVTTFPAALGKPMKVSRKKTGTVFFTSDFIRRPIFHLFDDRTRREIAICRGNQVWPVHDCRLVASDFADGGPRNKTVAFKETPRPLTRRDAGCSGVCCFRPISLFSWIRTIKAQRHPMLSPDKSWFSLARTPWPVLLARQLGPF